ncbi:MAG: hypothetical protein MUC92_10065 [Fimbriimonadaceae bacterium]|jgi:hypothetical protein|nr:hypothetical protein [Fimbriimonadaceae bacterium]
MVPSLLLLLVPNEPILVKIEPNKVIRRNLTDFFGINVNALRDNDANRPEALPLRLALQDLSPRWLRYPGGEKSDFLRWSMPPYDRPRPTAIGGYKDIPGEKLDFDAFLTHVTDLKVTPLVVVGCDSEKRSSIPFETYFQDAVALVRYAKEKGDLITYWEIGNENWHNQSGTPAEIARWVETFSEAMKKVNPRIKVGASGNSSDWWSRFLPLAADHLDFVTVSQYTGWEWKGYERFVSSPPPELIPDVRATVAAVRSYIPESRRSSFEVVVTEMNTKDYSEGGWQDANDIKHALVTFTSLGEMAKLPEVRSALVWNTRWIKDDEASRSMFYALDSQNRPLATGQALRLWASNSLPWLVNSSTPGSSVTSFASRSTDGSLVNVWLVNRTFSNQMVRIDLPGSGLRLISADEMREVGDGVVETRGIGLPRSPSRVTLSPLSASVWRFGRS